ncbi:MAG: hypothetical protein COB09_11275 [Thalassobium sp.]|nr:MAG: hypothetical protein COB09_11275 [Thalassobium sp.]
MTRLLFPIDLRGAGTSDVESLPSYIHRISIAHGVDVGQLLKIVNSDMPKLLQFSKSYMRPEEMICKGKTTDSLIEAFECATGQNLFGSTLWIVNNLVGRSTGEVVDGFRWCPECIEEMNKMDGAYFKLLWHMKSISACSVHRTRLISKCQHCGHDQTSYRKRHDLGCCQKCGQSLGLRVKPLSPKGIVSSWSDIGYDVVELFKEIADLDPIVMRSDGPFVSISDLHRFYSEAGRIDDFNRVLNPEDLRSLLYRHKPVSLMVVRRIAFGFGIPLLSFLKGDALKMIPLIENTNFCHLKTGYLESRKSNKRDHSETLEAINAARTIYPPLSLKALAKYVGVSKGYIEYRFPVVKNQVVAAYADYIKEKNYRNLHQAQAKAMAYFFEEKYSNSPQSRKQAYRILREETGLPKFVLRKAIQGAYEVMIGNTSKSELK